MANDTLRVRVARSWREAEGIQAYELVPAEGDTLPSFEPGAHLDVHVPGGAVRQYSLCNDARESHRYVIAVQRDAKGRGGSRALHDGVREGDPLTVSPPRNHFPLLFARSYVLVAGGIGITPLLAMARVLQRTGADWRLHYCTRSAERTAFLAELTEEPFAGRVHVHHDEGEPARGLDMRGVLATRPAGARLYCCGPAGLMKAVREAATFHQWPKEKVHFESFSAEGTAAALGAENAEFDIALRSTGQVLRVPKEESVLNVLRRNGLQVKSDCEAGTCGTCVTRVCEGQPEHRDTFFTPEAPAGDGRMLICVSRAKSKRLVLDL